MAWTQERIDVVKQMRLEGYSAALIARRLGDVTRSAVLGIIHRQKLHGDPDRRVRPGPRVAPQHRHKPNATAKRKPASNLPEPAQKRMASGEFATTITITDGICHFPVEGEGAATTYCGHNTEKSVYCPYHDDITHSTVFEIREESRKLWQNRKRPQLRLNSPLRGT